MGKDKQIEMTDITSEEYREYFWPGDAADQPSVRINAPMAINVSASGGHRIIDAGGMSNYVPAGWRHLRWKAKEGKPAFVF